MGEKYSLAKDNREDTVIYSGIDDDPLDFPNVPPQDGYQLLMLFQPSQTDEMLGVTRELQAAIEAESREQLQY